MIPDWDNDVFGCELKGTNNKTNIGKRCSRETVGRMKRYSTARGKYLQIFTSTKGSYPKCGSNNSIIREQLTRRRRTKTTVGCRLTLGEWILSRDGDE